MQIIVNKLPKSMIDIAGEIPAGDFEISRQKAVKKLAAEISMPGFRQGNIPEEMIIDKIGGENALLEEAAEIALKEAYFKILEENKIKAIGRPEIVIKKIARGNPLGFKIKTAVLPEIQLPNYKEMAKKILSTKKNDPEVSDEEVSSGLEYLRKMRAASEAPGTKPNNNEKPPDLPELNDAFAKSLGNFENLESLKSALRYNLLLEKQTKEKNRIREEIIKEISDSVSVEIPDTLIDYQQENTLKNLKSAVEGMKMNWEDYLKSVKKSENDFNEETREEAVKKVLYGLILDKIAEERRVNVADEEIKKEIEALTLHRRLNRQPEIDKEQLKDYAYNIIRNEKIFNELGA